MFSTTWLHTSQYLRHVYDISYQLITFLFPIQIVFCDSHANDLAQVDLLLKF